MLMKNNFQSKAVPRGTRTIWRYLSALFLLFTFAIGNVWAADPTYDNPSRSTYAEKTFLNVAGTQANVTGTDNYLCYGTLYMANTVTGDKFFARTSGSGGTSSSSYTYATPATGFLAANSTSATNTYGSVNAASSRPWAVYFTGATQVSVLKKDNNTSSNKWVTLKLYTVAADGTETLVETKEESSPDKNNIKVLSCATTLSASAYYKLEITSGNTSNCPIYQVSFKQPDACSTEITTQPSGATLAVGDANPELSIVATNVASYAWKESSDGTSYDGSSTLATTYNYTPSVNDAVQTKYYYCEVTSDCDGTTVVKSDIVTVNVVGAISYYTVTLNPAGGTIVDATGWTLNAGNYEKEVAEGTVLTLPTFTKTDRAFKTWRKAGPADVASPVTVDGDLSLTAIWTATIEQVIYSWEGAEGGAIETGGTAAGNVDNLINQVSAGYYCLKIDGNNSYSGNLVTITLAGEEKVKTGDKIKYWGFYNKTSSANARPKMRDANSPNAQIFDDGTNLPNLNGGGDPAIREFTVPADINTSAVQLTRSQTGSTTWIPKLQIIREVQVEEGELLTVTFDANGGSAIAPVVVASGQAVAKPADPTKAHNRFNEWQLSGSTYNFSTPVTANITLVANWTPLYTVTYAANGGSGTMTDANEYAAGDEVTLLENTFEAPDVTKIWDSWAVTDALDNPVSVSAGKFAMPSSNATVTAQWTTISDFDVKFFQGYGDPDVQIGTTQVISTGNYATAPDDPTRAGFAFLGWSYDATEAHIVDIATYGITAATNFTAMWKAVWTVTFDGAGNVEVQDGETVASPNSPVMAGKVFQGWYNAEVKYDFSTAVTGNLALTSKWADADPNHYVYAYNDDFHFDGVVYKTPEGAVDAGSGTSNIAMTTPYTLFEGAEGITSIVMTDGIYDSKTGAIQAVTALMKVNNNATSKLTVTIKSGYTATLKIKSSGYSATRTINVSDATPASGTTTGQAVTSGAMSVSGIGELSFALTSGSHDLTVTGGTLYIAELDIEATALPAHTVTYMPGEGSGAEFIDDDATEVSDGSTMFTAPEGKIFNGWKDGDNNDVEVGTIVTGDMTLTAQWINHYAVTFNLQGHGDAIDPQDIKEGAKATKPADPVVMGWDFGGWFTDAECTAGNEFDFETPIIAATPLFAKWTEFDGCALWYPATSGAALNVGDNVNSLTGSFGANVAVVGMKTAESSIAYNENGLFLSGGSADVISVTLNNDIAADTKISVTLKASGTGSRGLNILNATGGKVKGGTMLGWADATLGEVETFSYTVEAEDGLEGTNIFRLQRNNSVYLQCIKVESCGAAITYHNLTSAVVPAGKGTVTLGAGSVREGYTTTATYSDIDPLYEFVSWSVSGAGASVESATANPATITVGTEDAVVTLNLQLIPVKFTVNYYDGETLMGSELVAVNENPTASEIDTDKRHFTFQGWAETDGGSVVALNTITRTEATTVNLYAVYAPVACPASGTIFSVEIDDTKIPASTVKVAKNGGTLDVADYVIISGGKAIFINDESSDKDAISTSGQFKLVATKAVLKVELDCVLQENDIIRIDNNQKWVVSTSKTKSGTYQALTSSEHKFAVTAAWAGVDDLYFLYDGSSLSFTQIEVYRPGRYDVSFDMMGHGSAIADIEDVLEGSKITAPTAPTDEDYAFAGWYKENTLENEWDFDNDVVNAATTLYAKWINKSDATLKSLKYGSDEISLEDGVYEYEIALAAAVASVPALTAVTNNPAATAVVTDAAAFDEDGKATSTVVVTPEKEGAPTQTYTVNFTKLAALPQVGVSASTLWNFSLEGSTSLQNVEDVVLANLPGIVNDETFNSQALLASFNKLEGSYFQGSKLMFTVAEEGLLTIEFSGTNNHARHLQVCTGDGEIVIADWDYNSSSTHQTKSIEIPAGKITLKAFEGEGAQNARIYTLEYLALADRREAAWVAPGELGTVCLKDDAKVLGANVFKVVGCNASGYMVFDQITNGEIEAGKPYLFEATRNGSVAFFKTVGATHAETAESDKGMIGTFDGETLHPGTGNYCYFSGRHIWRVNDFSVDITVPAYCCYVDYDEFKNHPIPTAAPAPGLRRVVLGVNGKDEAQGLEDLDASETPMKVMIDGTLYILRGEKVFDATGRLVK